MHRKWGKQKQCRQKNSRSKSSVSISTANVMISPKNSVAQTNNHFVTIFHSFSHLLGSARQLFLTVSCLVVVKQWLGPESSRILLHSLSGGILAVIWVLGLGVEWNSYLQKTPCEFSVSLPHWDWFLASQEQQPSLEAMSDNITSTITISPARFKGEEGTDLISSVTSMSHFKTCVWVVIYLSGHLWKIQSTSRRECVQLYYLKERASERDEAGEVVVISDQEFESLLRICIFQLAGPTLQGMDACPAGWTDCGCTAAPGVQCGKSLVRRNGRDRKGASPSSHNARWWGT